MIGFESVEFSPLIIQEYTTLISSTSVDFGEVTVGDQSQRSFILTNAISRGLDYLLSAPSQVIIDEDDSFFALSPGESKIINT